MALLRLDLKQICKIFQSPSICLTNLSKFDNISTERIMKGFIISIEGTDGSGKHTQQQLLIEALKAENRPLFNLSFPNYESNSSAPVKMYLNGEFGADPNCLDAYEASVLYAVDRLCTYKKTIKPHYDAGEIIVFDRYIQSNFIHQCSKLNTDEEKYALIDWLQDLECNKLHLPKPDLVFFIEMPVEKSLELARARGELKNGEKKDIHEDNKAYMQRSYDTGHAIAEKFGWNIVHCVDENGNLKTIDEIHKEIMKIVKEYIK